MGNYTYALDYEPHCESKSVDYANDDDERGKRRRRGKSKKTKRNKKKTRGNKRKRPRTPFLNMFRDLPNAVPESQGMRLIQLTGRVTLIVPACQPGWEDTENLTGNLRKF